MAGKTPIVEVDVACVWEWVERRDDMIGGGGRCIWCGWR